jgi:predicted nucleotidyltransferase
VAPVAGDANVKTKKRTTGTAGRLAKALRALARVLEDLPAPAMLIGGMAVIARGLPRTTRDIDVAVLGGSVPLDRLLTRLEKGGFEPRIKNALAFARQNQVLLMRHKTSAVDLDLSLAWLSFEVEAISSADRLTLGGVRLPVARAEDLVIYKALAWRPQDQQDVERLILLHARDIDLGRVRRVVTGFAEAIDDPDRPHSLESVIRRALGTPRL